MVSADVKHHIYILTQPLNYGFTSLATRPFISCVQRLTARGSVTFCSAHELCNALRSVSVFLRCNNQERASAVTPSPPRNNYDMQSSDSTVARKKEEKTKKKKSGSLITYSVRGRVPRPSVTPPSSPPPPPNSSRPPTPLSLGSLRSRDL